MKAQWSLANDRSPAVLTAATIRERLTGTRLPEDPLAVVLTPEIERWPERLQRRLGRDLRPAGVLVPILERHGACTVLFTMRSPNMRYHAGQVSFPGGRMEPGDADIVATALRETHEEVGIEPGRVEVAGFLPPVPTVSGYAVTPIVGIVAPGAAIMPDPVEVERVFEVPLDYLLDPTNRRQGEREWQGHRVPYSEYRYGAERIWGATAGIVAMLASMLEKKG